MWGYGRNVNEPHSQFLRGADLHYREFSSVNQPTHRLNPSLLPTWKICCKDLDITATQNHVITRDCTARFLRATRWGFRDSSSCNARKKGWRLQARPRAFVRIGFYRPIPTSSTFPSTRASTTRLTISLQCLERPRLVYLVYAVPDLLYPGLFLSRG